MSTPSLERQYECMRILADCYQNFQFDDLYPLLSDNVKWFSQRRTDDVIWKDNVINYYKEKERSNRENSYSITQIVQLIGNLNKDSKVTWSFGSWGNPGKVMLFYEDWKICVFATQYIDGEKSNILIDVKYDWDMISEIWMCLPDLFKFRLWWPWDGEQIDWWKWIPQYKKEDTLRDEELCDFACHIVNDCFINKEWYKVLFASNFLNATPNYALEKNWKIILLIVRWCEAPNMPLLNPIEKDFFIKYAKKQWLELYFAPVSFWSSDPERFNKWLLLRWDWFYANFTWIEPLK